MSERRSIGLLVAGGAAVSALIVVESRQPHIDTHNLHLPTPQVRDIDVYNPVTPSHTMKPLESFPTIPTNPYALENVAPGFLVPVHELSNVLPIDVPTFPAGYVAEENAEVTKLSPSSRLVNVRATNEYDDVLSMYVTDAAIEHTGLSHSEIVNGMEVEILTHEDGSIHFQWQVGASFYYLSGPNYPDMFETLKTLDAFQERN